jgi:hypothetical protein
MVSGDGLLHVLGQVVPQVPAVGDLDRVRCGLPGALGVGASAVPADDLGVRVRSQPGGEGGGLPISQQVHRTVGRHVDQHGAVAMTAAQGEVVHAQLGHAGGLGVGQGAQQPQHRRPAGLDAQQVGQSRTAAACQRQADCLQQLA